MMRYQDRKERAAARRKHDRRANLIGCAVWEQSGIGMKDGTAWHVTNAAINAAVKFTYVDGIDDEQWIVGALAAYLDSIAKDK